jgi:hypothetical protein
MRTSLGVSVGSEVVYSALLTTSAEGAQSFEYRTITADEANVDLGELVASSIELMTTQVRQTTVEPSGIAVAYRNEDQTRSIRSAAGPRRRDLQLVPEPAAALAYLHYTGEVAQFETVAIADLGASGLTVTIVDQADGTVLDSHRSTEVGGNAVDDALYRHVASHRLPAGSRPSRTESMSRVRTAKEHLTNHDTTTVEYAPGRHRNLTRADLERVIAPLVASASAFVTTTIDAAPRRPDGLVLIGGGANMPALVSGLTKAFAIPVLRPTEPETVLAKGAALVADSVQPMVYPVVRMPVDAPIGTFTRVAGAIAGALVVIGLIIGYGVQSLTVSNGEENVSPAATLDRADEGALVNMTPSSAVPAPPLPTYEYSEPSPAAPTYDYGDLEALTTAAPVPRPLPETPRAAPQSGPPSPTTTNPSTMTPSPSAPTTAPQLHPAPDLTAIPWPTVPEWLDDNQNPDTGTPDPRAPERSRQPPDQRPSPTTTNPAPPPPPPLRPGTGSAG